MNRPEEQQEPQVFVNITAEQAVIGALMINPAKLDDVRDMVGVEDFAGPANLDVFNAICELADDSKPTDAVTVAEQIASNGGKPDLGFLTDLTTHTPSAVNVMAYANIVAQCAAKRAVYRTSNETVRYLMEHPNLTASQALEYAQARVMELNDSHRSATESIEINEALKAYVDHVDELFQKGDAIDGLATNLTDLDGRVNGYKPGKLIVIAGRPSQGKSTIGMNFAENFSVMGRKRGIFFSLEMTHSELMEKLVASTGRISLNHLGKPKSGGEAMWPKLSAAVSRCMNSPLSIVDRAGMHINQLKSFARKAHKREPLDYIVVDHMHLMDADGDRNVDKFGAISRGCKQLAKELGIPVFLLAQLSRKVDERGNKRPVLSDLRESGRIEEDADIVHFVYRDEYYNEKTDNPGIMEFITAKFRGGKVGTDLFSCNLEISRVDDLAPGSYVPFQAPASTRSRRDAL